MLKKINIKRSDITYVGIGSPGTVDSIRGIIVTSNNIVMKHFPMVEAFRSHFDIPVYIDNDANCAALGEIYNGAAKGHDTAIMITLGTGIGGGVIINKKIYGGSFNAGAELGHTVIVSGGEQCTCGRRGCWEAYASATALIRQAKKAAESNPGSILNKYLAENGRISGRTVFEAAKKGDKAAKAVVDEYILYVAEGITNLVNIFRPEVVLVGGGIAEQGETLFAPIRDYVQKYNFTGDLLELPEIKQAKLGNDAGILGAAMLAEGA